MIITAITIENFKGISNPVRVELKPITLLFGANSVGKSTIVQALHYVREILERNNVDADRCLGADESMDLGGFRNLVHGHDLNSEMRFRLELELEAYDLPDYKSILREGPTIIDERVRHISNFVSRIETAWVEIVVKWDASNKVPYTASYSIGYSENVFATIACSAYYEKPVLKYLDLLHHIVRDACGFLDLGDIIYNLHNSIIISNKSENGIVRNYDLENMVTCIPNWGKSLKLNDDYYREAFELADSKYNHETKNNDPIDLHCENVCEFESYLSQLIVGPGELVLNELKQSRYIGPIRKIPPRGYTPPRYADETRWASGLAAWDLLQKSKPELVSATSDWLSRNDRLNSGYSLRVLRLKKLDMASDLYAALVAKGAKGKTAVGTLVAELPEEKQLLLTDQRRGLDVLPQDVGIGISQILPVVVGALDDDTSILMVEQPELHIHPGLQCNLGDLFISQIQKEGKTFIIETHSEHLLLRLLRRIRENNDNELPEGVAGLTPEQVSVNYVELTEEGLRIRPMHISEDGDSLGEWPRGFFEERAKELL